MAVSGVMSGSGDPKTALDHTRGLRPTWVMGRLKVGVRCYQRQHDFEDGAAVVARGDGAAVPFDDRLDDRQAEAAAARRFARGIRLVEAVEDEREMLGRDAGTGVPDGDEHAP